MRSTAFTILLIFVAVLTCGLAGWYLVSGGTTSLFGVPATPVGQRLYTSFTPGEVVKIQITTQGVAAEFEKTSNGWAMREPCSDRMDPRAAVAIIDFTLSAKVEDSAPVGEVPLDQAGLGDTAVHVRLEGADGRPLAKYRMGRRASWQGTDAQSGEAVPTVFVQPWDRNRKSHVFTCTGTILPLFKSKLAFLRDHHPFFFHPDYLRKIRIRSAEGELTLGRDTPKEAWRIIKPLSLNTNPETVKKLIECLSNLQAVALTDRSAVTPPLTANPSACRQIALTQFGSDTEQMLEIHPPESPTARVALATMSDRPGTAFSLPLKSEAELVTLADLPLAVNELRDPTLTRLNVKALESVLIQPATSGEIFIRRENPKLWTTMIDGVKCHANELRLYELLQAVTTERVTGFESDAATDFTPWGLDRPILKLTFTIVDGSALTLRLGLDKHGDLFVNRAGTASVMKLNRSLLDAIAIHGYEWRQARLWSLSTVDLQSVQRSTPLEPDLVLAYDNINENWQGTQRGQDITGELRQDAAKYMLGGLEGLEVVRWLNVRDEAAAAALAKPVLTLKVEERTVDANGENGPLVWHELIFAPVPGVEPAQLYYGRMRGETYPFMIDSAAFEKLAVPVLGDK